MVCTSVEIYAGFLKACERFLYVSNGTTGLLLGHVGPAGQYLNRLFGIKELYQMSSLEIC